MINDNGRKMWKIFISILIMSAMSHQLMNVSQHKYNLIKHYNT